MPHYSCMGSSVKSDLWFYLQQRRGRKIVPKITPNRGLYNSRYAGQKPGEPRTLHREFNSRKEREEKDGVERFQPPLPVFPPFHCHKSDWLLVRAFYSAIVDDKLVTLTSLVNMWTPEQKMQCVLWLTEFKSVTRVQRCVQTEWNVDSPTSKSIHQWERTLKETGVLLSLTGKYP
ncbi:uncharacterized protein TNCV_4074661 [Trichonephila clavipes]|nr:uncharacterized protein TNCV_4074661 [Trichonephila clavipes]